jgi:hypothetical protein
VEYPGFERLMTATLSLGILGFASSKGIRAQKSDRALRVASHDYLDALHICYGLHCSLFVTRDKIAARKAQLLRDYWRIACAIAVIEKAG